MSYTELIEKIKLDPKPKIQKIDISYLGRPSTFEILGFLEYPDGKIVTPDNLGKMLGFEHLSMRQTMIFLNLYSIEKWDGKMLEPYPVTMEIAQHHPSIFEERKGKMMLTNTIASRSKEDFRIGMKPCLMGCNSQFTNEYIIFFDGCAKAEDIEGKVSYLDKNFWPASEGTKVTRPTYSYKSEANEAPVVVNFENDKVNIYTTCLESCDGDDLRLPICKRIR